MVHLMEYRKDKTALDKIDDLFDEMSWGQEYGTILVSLVRVFIVK